MKPTLSPESSQKIVNFSFLAAVAICAAHARWFSPSLPAFAHEHAIKRIVADQALLFFFIVSGYFLARHYGEPGWWRQSIRKRIGTIMIPYCVWQLAEGVVGFFVEGRWTLRPGGFGLNPFIYPKLVPLWYLRNLMLLVVASPLVFWCVRRWGGRLLAVLFAAWLFRGGLMELGLTPIGARMEGFLSTTFTVHGLFCFAFGAHLAWHPMALSRRAGSWCGVAALAVISARLTLLFLGVRIPFDLQTLFDCLSLAFVWTHLPASRMPKFLAEAAFPIYLVHGIIVLTVCSRTIEYRWYTPVVELLLGVGGSIAVSALLRRCLPRVARLAFGGR